MALPVRPKGGSSVVRTAATLACALSLLAIAVAAEMSPVPGKSAGGPDSNALATSADHRVSLGTAIPEAPWESELSADPSGPGISPYQFHTDEPAPMGIADYGVTAPGGSWYFYNSSAVRGLVAFGSNPVVSNSSLPADRSAEFAIQLNAMYAFGVGENMFVYWVQDVVIYNTSSDQIVGFLDNVWNDTGPGAQVLSTSITGNGTVATSSSHTAFYVDVANSSLPGSSALAFTAPNQFALEMDAFQVDGVPGLAFSYTDGFGQVVYDTATFPWAATVSVFYGFVVDGKQLNPFGAPYDLELILGGPGGGAQTTDVASELYFRLLYFNGHNFQSPTNAFNFGDETAEGSQDVEAAGVYADRDGNISSELTNGDSSNSILVQMYNSSRISELNVSVPSSVGQPAVLAVNGEPTLFTGGAVSLILHPGVYYVNVTVAGQTTSFGACQLNAGAELSVSAATPCPASPPATTSSENSGSLASPYPWIVLGIVVVVIACLVGIVLVRRRRSTQEPAGSLPPGGVPWGAVGTPFDPHSPPVPGSGQVTAAAAPSPPLPPENTPATSSWPSPSTGSSPPASPAPPPGNPPVSPPCPRCGAPIMYVSQYNRWYCPREQSYL